MNMMRPVDIAAVGVDASSGIPVVLLREREAPHRVLPILVAPSDAAAIALPATGQTTDRPMTHDLLAQVLEQFGAHVDAAEVTEVRDGTFLARLTFHDAAGERQLDTRPSDAIALALRAHAPVLVSEEVLDVAGAIPDEGDEDEPIDQETIDETVEEFRAFLDEISPAEFDEPSVPDEDEMGDDRPSHEGD